MGAVRALLCHTPDCVDADDVVLTEPGFARPAPALALDQQGRPMIATYDRGNARLVLIVCVDASCTERETVPLARVEHGAGHLDIALTPDGRPQVLWADSGSDRARLRLTTCVTPDCRRHDRVR